MLKIKLNNQFPNWPWLRQTPNQDGVWKNATFFVNNDEVKECDYFIVFGGLSKEEEVNVSGGASVFIALENKDICKYNQKFLNQFDIVLTHRYDIKHKKVINIPFPCYWFLGVDLGTHKILSDKSYTFFKETLHAPLNKTKLISVIASSKSLSPGHQKRIEFVNALKNKFGDKIDYFGKGVNDFEDKWDVLAPYKYHIVLENSQYKNEITEKLYDSLLANCISIYSGAPNVQELFPNSNLVKPININNIPEALSIIEKIVFKENIDYIQEQENFITEKKAILDRYNLFESIYSNLPTKFGAKKMNIFKPESIFSNSKSSFINIGQIFKRLFR